MKIPLLVQANPFKCISPGVYLPKGKWTIRGDFKSELHLVTSNNSVPLVESMVVEGGSVHSIKVITPFHSETLTIHAELCLSQ